MKNQTQKEKAELLMTIQNSTTVQPDATRTEDNNVEKQKVLDWFDDWDNSTPLVMLGNAGTGKTTLIRKLDELCDEADKYCAIVAPTGVAAYNIGIMASTIHSFFSLPAIDHLISDQQFLFSTAMGYHLSLKLKKLDMLIIDEISMVRADLLDAISFLLQTVRSNKQPFGGVKVLLSGDIYQLPPILDYKTRKEFLQRYSSEFFFHSKVIAAAYNAGTPLPLIELKKIYRQTDTNFIELLNRIRINDVDELDMDEVNSRVRDVTNDAKAVANNSAFELRITAVNAAANEFNAAVLGELSGIMMTHNAVIKNIERDFPKSMYPTDEVLEFKVGAQIMFINNDQQKRWVNGTLGKIVSIEENNTLIIRTDRNEIVTVSPHTFEHNGYAAGTFTTIATFTQYPFRLAWAVSIHKSQGLTFDKITIDFCGKVFATGLIYVALSRCRSMEGVKLVSPLKYSDYKTNKLLQNYRRYFNTNF